jgi:hypothetical protein
VVVVAAVLAEVLLGPAAGALVVEVVVLALVLEPVLDAGPGRTAVVRSSPANRVPTTRAAAATMTIA